MSPVSLRRARLSAVALAFSALFAPLALAQEPPSAAKAIADLERLPVCAKGAHVYVHDLARNDEMRAAGKAILVRRCSPSLRRSFFGQIWKTRTSATCRTLVDVDRSGAASPVETRCLLASPKDLDPAWRDYFTEVLIAAIQRSSQQWEFEPAEESDPRLVREGEVEFTLEVDGAVAPALEPFERVSAP
jgi:hypothetical protein